MKNRNPSAITVLFLLKAGNGFQREPFPAYFINLGRQSYFSDDQQTKSADNYRGQEKKECQDQALYWSHPK